MYLPPIYLVATRDQDGTRNRIRPASKLRGPGPQTDPDV
jgi:hypothetical protein